jgi:hypothetical protein
MTNIVAKLLWQHADQWAYGLHKSSADLFELRKRIGKAPGHCITQLADISYEQVWVR